MTRSCETAVTLTFRWMGVVLTFIIEWGWYKEY